MLAVNLNLVYILCKSCASFPFLYNLADYVITGNLKIINNTSLRDVFAKGLKNREPKSIKWKHNFKILMDSIENYARQHEEEDLDTLSKWVWGHLYKFELKNSVGLWALALHQSLNVAKPSVSPPWQICNCLHWQGP